MIIRVWIDDLEFGLSYCVARSLIFCIVSIVRIYLFFFRINFFKWESMFFWRVCVWGYFWCYWVFEWCWCGSCLSFRVCRRVVDAFIRTDFVWWDCIFWKLIVCVNFYCMWVCVDFFGIRCWCVEYCDFMSFLSFLMWDDDFAFAFFDVLTRI